MKNKVNKIVLTLALLASSLQPAFGGPSYTGGTYFQNYGGGYQVQCYYRLIGDITNGRVADAAAAGGTVYFGGVSCPKFQVKSGLVYTAGFIITKQ